MPGRKVVISPQGGGPFVMASATLPAATMGAPYTQTILPYASAGILVYGPFTLQSQTGADNFAVSTAGIVTGTPEAPSLLVTDDGSYMATDTTDLLSVS